MIQAVASLPVLGLAMAIMATASAIQAAFGMGVGLLAVPLLGVFAPSFAPGPMMFAAIGLALAMAYRDRAALDQPTLLRCLAGMLVGTALGAAALTVLPRDALGRTSGVLVLVAVLLSVLGIRFRATPRALLLGSTVGGVMGIMAGLHGPPLAVVLQNEEPRRIRALMGAFFVAGYAAGVMALSLVALFGWDALLRGVLLMPGVAVGTALGPWIGRFLDRQVMRAALLALSAASAMVLLWR